LLKNLTLIQKTCIIASLVNQTRIVMEFKCKRCGETVTAPRVHKGSVYGYTCYKIVTGGKVKKDSKLTGLWVEADEIIVDGDFSFAVINGIQFPERSYLQSESGPVFIGKNIVDGYVKVANDKKGFQPIWRGRYIMTDNNSPLYMYVLRGGERVKFFEW